MHTEQDPFDDDVTGLGAPETGARWRARTTGPGGERVARDRWLAALCYAGFLVLIPIFFSDKSRFLARHCRQGFALFFAEVVAWILLATIESTIGRIPILGFLISILLVLAVTVVFLAISVLGFVKALAGEDWRVPFLDELADRVPIQ
ncbi:MAG: hypothetical protein R6X25_01280 [Candidatus Krumholzibacteriia bacterium]